MGRYNLETWELESEPVKDIILSGNECDLISVLPWAFCEDYVGRIDVKRGMLAMLASPHDLKLPGGRTRRDRMHILLNGVPGTGKTVFIEHLSTDWGAKYISSEPTGSSLKGDARRKDKGVQIFRQYNGGMVCIDDIELMGDSDLLRDVMERGRYSLTKGGEDAEYESQCRIIAATNDFSELSPPMLSRFDLIYDFNKPSIKETLDIAKVILDFDEDNEYYIMADLVKDHIRISQSFSPSKLEKPRMLKCIQDFLDERGRGGDTGRWVSSVLRISRNIAKVRLQDMGPRDVLMALQMKSESDVLLGV
jgi:DNA replicative helicase MCM subunit Mcm2 (Cdc46/Mcm family)